MENAVAATTPPVRNLRRARDLVNRPRSGRWDHESLRGLLTELVGGAESANVSVAVQLILQAQTTGLAAWVATHRDVFFPPDFAAAGVNLETLPVVWAVDRGTKPTAAVATDAAATATAAATDAPSARAVAAVAVRAAERLLRSGAFTLVVIDLGRDLDLPIAGQGRLLRLAEQHCAQVLVLRRKRRDDAYSGSLIAVRAESRRATRRGTENDRSGGPEGRFVCTIINTKDKREGPGWTTSEEFDGPPGLC